MPVTQRIPSIIPANLFSAPGQFHSPAPPSSPHIPTGHFLSTSRIRSRHSDGLMPLPWSSLPTPIEFVLVNGRLLLHRSQLNLTSRSEFNLLILSIPLRRSGIALPLHLLNSTRRCRGIQPAASRKVNPSRDARRTRTIFPSTSPTPSPHPAKFPIIRPISRIPRLPHSNSRNSRNSVVHFPPQPCTFASHSPALHGSSGFLACPAMPRDLACAPASRRPGSSRSRLLAAHQVVNPTPPYRRTLA